MDVKYLINQDLDSWKKEHSLQIKSSPCPECGKLRVSTIPFVDDSLRGLASPDHGCGGPRLFTFVDTSMTKEEIDNVSEMFKNLSK